MCYFTCLHNKYHRNQSLCALTCLCSGSSELHFENCSLFIWNHPLVHAKSPWTRHNFEMQFAPGSRRLIWRLACKCIKNDFFIPRTSQWGTEFDEHWTAMKYYTGSWWLWSTTLLLCSKACHRVKLPSCRAPYLYVLWGTNVSKLEIGQRSRPFFSNSSLQQTMANY